MDKIKASVIGVFTAIFSWFGIVAIPVFILIAFNIIDYATGLMASPYRGEQRTSYKSIRGIKKKVGMWLLVGACALLDIVIMGCGQYVGISLPLNFIIAIIACLWLIFNEFISVCENLRDIGTKVPPFMLNIATKVLGKVEKVGDTLVKEGEANGD